ncbi:MAG: ferritin [Candidatus Syntrophoarchaeum sp.]|nr:ferritin [Candidatus Syntrophoarchaeum sp.]
MLSEKMYDALNTQINREIYSAYLYLSMSAYSTYIGLKGFANWFMVQYQEEMAHAMKLYDYINELADLAIEERDHATGIFLQWFVTEQIEEESNDNEIIARLKLIGDDGNGLLMLDKELGMRVFTPPATSEGA